MTDDSNPYFSVPHSFKAFLTLWPKDQGLPTENELQGLQSIGLQLLSEVKNVESNCLMQLRQLESDTKSVVDYLKLQSKKIDLILQYVLESEPQDGEPALGLKFGGGGIEVLTDFSAQIGQHYKSTVFIRDELIALLAITSVDDCQPHPNEANKWVLTLSFQQIIEADVELLVKASLSVQQKMLKKRSQNRQQ
ncbi:hypothetical protein D5R81_06385 [Parashewanella spongiae]|uniref:PilZ domain-containing protein n=1 Tax=Parashewanella spongiae TaxID=342950 RepID=A0A3A6U2D6_9GAMM|nr:hypothetical protein [Parashewanella spongiae]MCL1077572.1 hypothetical protein [Parashewanella spongiae]RJY18196.1 hypothetical protein D5R81_06385 [Parashewanella spongiae]